MTTAPSLVTPPPGFRLFHVVAMFFVFSLLVANTIAVKVVVIGPFTLPAGIIVFPIAYILGDVLTEAYGFERARSVIWSGFACLIGMALFYWIATLLAPAPFWTDQEAFSRLFGFVPRIVFSSLAAYMIGELLNSVVLSKLKVATQGRHFWLRAISSTAVGQGADSLVFNVLAFVGVFPMRTVLQIAVSGWVLKTAYEIIVLPVTYVIVAWIKRVEGVDVFDTGVSYNPFPRN